MKAKLTVVALLAFAAGGTCPSDVDNDGTVGINDFLQVLSDWGPCPSASVVGVGAVGGGPSTNGWAVRVWSDGRIEGLLVYADPEGCAKVKGSPPHDTWFDFGTTPNSIPPVTTSIPGENITVALEDGTVWKRAFFDVSTPGNNPCGLVWSHDWAEFGATP